MMISTENIDTLAWGKGLLPAVIQDARTGILLMQAYMDEDALRETLASGKVTFYSRSRDQLWQKGETSGNVLDFQSAEADCDLDSLKILATPTGPVCHRDTPTCWDGENEPSMTFLSTLEEIIKQRSLDDPKESYTARLKKNGVKFIAQKVGEEAVETALAAVAGDREEILDESADLMYHLLVLLNQLDLSLSDVADVLKSRHPVKPAAEG